eukprot:gb/GFBE01013493.1/.p1 GENE.gb/GFBE01013493.1/~~gb/GFBE01013493.1/.p1  ORF type:complete len:238 (+),score=37.24 gb/GFBE01013493.1/:1-714(+)
MAQAAKPVFLAVARVSDGAVLGSRYDGKVTSQDRRWFDASLKSMLTHASRTAYPGWRERSSAPVGDDSSSTLFALLDHQAVCLFVVGFVGGQYPDRVAFQLLGELSELVHSSSGRERLIEGRPGELSETLKGPMREVFRTYSDPVRVDKASDVQQKVDSLKVVMQDNVRKILETHASLEALDQSAKSMSESANKFLRQSANLKRELQIRNLKIKVITGCCLTAVAAYFSLPVLAIFN